MTGSSVIPLLPNVLSRIELQEKECVHNHGLNLDPRLFWPEQELCAIGASVGVNAHKMVSGHEVKVYNTTDMTWQGTTDGVLSARDRELYNSVRDKRSHIPNRSVPIWISRLPKTPLRMRRVSSANHPRRQSASSCAVMGPG